MPTSNTYTVGRALSRCPSARNTSSSLEIILTTIISTLVAIVLDNRALIRHHRITLEVLGKRPSIFVCARNSASVCECRTIRRIWRRDTWPSQTLYVCWQLCASSLLRRRSTIIRPRNRAPTSSSRRRVRIVRPVRPTSHPSHACASHKLGMSSLKLI